MFGYALVLEQRHACRDSSRGQIFGQLDPHSGVSDDPLAGDELLDLAADVGGVPRRSLRAESRQDRGDGFVAVECARTRRGQSRGACGGAEPELVQLIDPPVCQRRAIGRDDLVGACLRPGPPVPGAQEVPARLSAGVGVTPRGLISLDVPSDLARSSRERSGETGQLIHLARLTVEGETAFGERLSKLRIAHHGRVADAVDRVDHVADADGVETSPLACGPDAGVHLQVEMTMWVART